MEKVTVIGGGIAGLEVALRTEREGFDVKLVEPKDSLLFYPSAHRLLEGESEDSFTINYRKKFSGRNIEHVKGKAESVGFDEQKFLAGGTEINYDYLVIAVGSETQFHDVPGQEKACTMRFKEETKKIYKRIKERDNQRIAIVGGGPTGVEATASLLELREEEDFEVSIIHGSERLLPNNNPELGRKARKLLERKGVEVVLGEKVVEVKDSEVTLESDESSDADLVLWAGGVKPNSLINDLELERDEEGLKVDEYQRTDRENVYAAGDICSYEGKVSRALYGIFEAKTVARNIVRKSKGRDLEQRRIKWDPEIIYLGERNSALEFKNICLTGLIPSLIRTLGVEKRYLWTRKYWL